MVPQYDWPLALGALGGVLIGAAGLSFILGGRKVGKRLLQVGLVAVVAGAVLPGVNWQAWLPDYLSPTVVKYALYVIGFLVAMNLLRHFLALFVGRGAADSAVGNLLSSAITSVFVMLALPFRILRRLGGRSPRSPFDNT